LKDRVKIGLAVVLLCVAGVLLGRHLLSSPDHGEDLAEGTFWICQNPDCRAEFHMSLDEVKELMDIRGTVPCPQCGERQTIRGIPCPHCKRPYEPVGHGEDRDICPHCNKPIPVPDMSRK
jgi:hypothetical protein